MVTRRCVRKSAATSHIDRNIDSSQWHIEQIFHGRGGGVVRKTTEPMFNRHTPLAIRSYILEEFKRSACEE